MLPVKCLEHSLALCLAHTLNVSWLYGLVDQMTLVDDGHQSLGYLRSQDQAAVLTGAKQQTEIGFSKGEQLHATELLAQLQSPGGLCSDSPSRTCRSSIQQRSVPQVLWARWIHWIRGQRFLDQLKAFSCSRLPSKPATSQITKAMSWNSTSKSGLQNPKRSASSTSLHIISNTQT